MGRLLSDFTIYKRASCLIRISGPLALTFLPCLPTSQQSVWLLLGTYSSKSSFLHLDSAAEETTSIVSKLLLGNRHLAHLITFYPSFSFSSLPDHADSISSILNVSFIYCPVFPFRSASAYSGSQLSSRTWQALITSRDGYRDCDWYSLLHLLPPTSYLNQIDGNLATF